jgi:hypothetical protein
MDKLEENIGLLPDIIKLQIYNDHFYPKFKFKEMIELLESTECQQLKGSECIKLSVYIKEMLTEDKLFLEYTLKHGVEYRFNIVYNEAVIKGEKHFKLFTCPYKSFALAWIHYLYY